MRRVFSVSQINSYIHRIFESDYALKNIYLKGEVSNCKYHSSGHIYFTLKDERSAIRCIMFASDRYQGLKFRLQDGQMIIAGGRISVFEQKGEYQLYVKEAELSGEGELYIRYEQQKRELSEKGYFDFERKKELPAFPEQIGIVTAETGAAIQDILSVAKRRNPFVQLYLYPAKVQGEGAAQEIAEGIRYLDRFGVDLIIIGRGGGSIEDLWAFNEMVVADAIYHAKTPIVSGTGHEIDMTIADYCADVRAATPSAACELAVPDVYSLMHRLDQYLELLTESLSGQIQELRKCSARYEKMIGMQSPQAKLMSTRLRLKDYERRLDRGMETRYQSSSSLCAQIHQELHRCMENRLRDCQHKSEIYTARLHALSPTAKLGGGYAFAQTTEGEPISSVRQIENHEPFELIFRDGRATVRPEAVSGASL